MHERRRRTSPNESIDVVFRTEQRADVISL